MSATNASFTLSPELLYYIKAIQIRTRRSVNELLSGEYLSAFKGRGMEFEEVREYVPGDDVRHIDWNVTARMQAPFVKSYREERELTVLLLVDVSASGKFGSQGRSKRDVAAEVGALLAHAAIRNNDRVGLVLFSDRVEHHIPPKKGRGHVWRVIRDILTYPGESRGTDLTHALEFCLQSQRRQAATFLISDFLDTHELTRPLQLAATRHDVTAVRIVDPREGELPNVGLLEIADLESGEHMVVDSASPKARQRYAECHNTWRRRQDELFRACRVGQVDIRTDLPTAPPIVKYFRTKERRR